MRLEALFRLTSIAVVGASDKPTIGRRLIASLDRIGFAGPIFPINPNYSAASGRQCYANIAELPETPDVAVFCVGHARVLDTLLAAAARRARGRHLRWRVRRTRPTAAPSRSIGLRRQHRHGCWRRRLERKTRVRQGGASRPRRKSS